VLKNQLLFKEQTLLILNEVLNLLNPKLVLKNYIKINFNLGLKNNNFNNSSIPNQYYSIDVVLKLLRISHHLVSLFNVLKLKVNRELELLTKDYPKNFKLYHQKKDISYEILILFSFNEYRCCILFYSNFIFYLCFAFKSLQSLINW